jgi:hypothetical protein
VHHGGRATRLPGSQSSISSVTSTNERQPIVYGICVVCVQLLGLQWLINCHNNGIGAILGDEMVSVNQTLLLKS